MGMIKDIAKKVVPERFRRAVRYVTSSDYRDRLSWEEDRQIGERIFGLTGGRVVAGPFEGLKYVSRARGSSIGAKLLGTYELELRDVVEAIVSHGYRTIINIGAGEGYYSVGLAKRLPGARVVSFDADASNQAQIKELAALNGVLDRMEINGFCDEAALARAIGDATGVLVICDIEGAEVEVLNPDAVPALRQADLLVEMHDIIRDGCSDALRARFAGTHSIHVIPTRRRTVADFPAGVAVEGTRERLSVMDEKRGNVPMTFFWGRVKGS
jgi:hypothetical protein